MAINWSEIIIELAGNKEWMTTDSVQVTLGDEKRPTCGAC